MAVLLVVKKLDVKDMIGDKEQEYNQFTNIDQRESNDLISMLANNELLDKKKLKTNSRVKFEQVSILAKLHLYTDTFGETFTRKLADLILQLQISTNGLGRKELVQMVQQRDMFDMMQQKPKTSKDIFR